MITSSLVMAMTGCTAKKKAVASTNEGKHPSEIHISSDTQGFHVPSDKHGKLRPDQQMLVEEAMSWLGTPYRYGGEEKNKGTDCSGMAMMVYKNALGIKIPRTSREQQKFCAPIVSSQLEAGDLIFFCTGRDKTRVSHVGLYVGDGKFVHSSSSKGVIISHLGESYYSRVYHSSGHVNRRHDSDSKYTENPETQIMQFHADPQRIKELDKAIEQQIDSVYTSFFE